MDMIVTLKVIVSVFVAAFVFWGVIDYIIQRVLEWNETNEGRVGNSNPPSEGGGHQAVGVGNSTTQGNPKDVRCKIIREPKEVRIYGMLPYNFYILSLASLFGVYLMFHGVRDDVRSLYEIVKTPKIKIVGSEKCVGDSCQCKKDSCTDVKVVTTNQTMNDQKGK